MDGGRIKIYKGRESKQQHCVFVGLCAHITHTHTRFMRKESREFVLENIYVRCQEWMHSVAYVSD